jgi:hypothetical protein
MDDRPTRRIVVSVISAIEYHISFQKLTRIGLHCDRTPVVLAFLIDGKRLASFRIALLILRSYWVGRNCEMIPGLRETFV